MTYYDLLCDPNYFSIFLNVFNSKYNPDSDEPHYRDLIKRYLQVKTSEEYSHLISDNSHIYDAYESLRVEFGMGKRSAKLVEFDQFIISIQENKDQFKMLNNYDIKQMINSSDFYTVSAILKDLFNKLNVVPEKINNTPKLVAVSKVLHFLLPNLVMPVDRESVEKFIYLKDKTPGPVDKQFDLFIDVFRKYASLAHKLNLNNSNGDGNWWNVSVPKRIDNAVSGFWKIFNPENIQTLICSNINQLLSQLNVP